LFDKFKQAISTFTLHFKSSSILTINLCITFSKASQKSKKKQLTDLTDVVGVMYSHRTESVGQVTLHRQQHSQTFPERGTSLGAVRPATGCQVLTAGIQVIVTKYFK